MKTVTNIADHRVSWVKARPLNCDVKLKDDERCPNCKQVHLRVGYCQALDPINAKQYPHLHDHAGETLTETLSDNETPSLCAECGDPFQAVRASARYCSSACRLKAHRASAAKQSG